MALDFLEPDELTPFLDTIGYRLEEKGYPGHHQDELIVDPLEEFEKLDFDKIPNVEQPNTANFNVFSGIWKAIIFIGIFGALGFWGFRKQNLLA